MLTNFALPYPFCSITVITFSGLVKWALCTRLKRDSPIRIGHPPGGVGDVPDLTALSCGQVRRTTPPG